MIKVLSYLCDCPKGALRIVLVLALTVTAFGQHTLATREFFYVGGNYSGPPLKEVMAGQMYVEVLRPQRSHTKVSHRVLSWRRTGLRLIGWDTGWSSRLGGLLSAQGYIVYLTRSACARTFTLERL